MEKIEEFIGGSERRTKLPWGKYAAAGLTVAILMAGAFWMGGQKAVLLPPAQTDTQAPHPTLQPTEATAEPVQPSPTITTEATGEAEKAVPTGNSVTNLCNGGIIALLSGNRVVYRTSASVHWFNRLDTEPETWYYYDSEKRSIYTNWEDGEHKLRVELKKDVECRYLYVDPEWLYCVLKQDDGSYAMCRVRNYPENHYIGPIEPIVENVLPDNRFAIRDGYIYYWIYAEGLFRCSLDGSSPELLFDNGGSDNLFGLITFHVSEENVYFWASTGGIYSVPVTGGAALHLLNTREMDGVPTHAVEHDGYFYYVMEKQTDGVRTAPAELWCVKSDGSNNQHIAVLDHADQEVLHMNVGNAVYLRIKTGENVGLYQIPLSGGQLKLLSEY